TRRTKPPCVIWQWLARCKPRRQLPQTLLRQRTPTKRSTSPPNTARKECILNVSPQPTRRYRCGPDGRRPTTIWLRRFTISAAGTKESKPPGERCRSSRITKRQRRITCLACNTRHRMKRSDKLGVRGRGLGVRAPILIFALVLVALAAYANHFENGF